MTLILTAAVQSLHASAGHECEGMHTHIRLTPPTPSLCAPSYFGIATCTMRVFEI